MAAETLRQTISRLMPQAREDLARLVAFASVATPGQPPPEPCRDAARWVTDAFAALGFADAAAHQTADGSEVVVGHAPGPPGAPTVLLYSHYDVQPAGDESAWSSPPFALAERDGRWYGRGTADCKGNIVMHLTALRALGAGAFPVSVGIVIEGSEERGSAGLEAFVPEHADLLRADAIVIGDGGNSAAGVPTMTTTLRGIGDVVVRVRALRSAVHSGTYGGAAPDALAALIHMLATLRDERGNTTVRGLDAAQVWSGTPYSPERFRADATVLDDVELLGDGAVADMIWARPALTVIGIDCPPVDAAMPAIQPEARAALNLRVPPGHSAARAQDALVEHLRAVAPWNVHVAIERKPLGEPFAGGGEGPAHRALAAAMGEAYGREAITEGQGGSIPVCSVLAGTFPEAEIMLIGVEEPLCRIHAPDESVDPAEVEQMALAEALFLRGYAAAASG